MINKDRYKDFDYLNCKNLKVYNDVTGKLTNEIATDHKGQRYLTYPDGQTRRISSKGEPVQRVRLSKKKRRLLRKEYREVRSLNASELADNLLDTDKVVNPIQVTLSKKETSQ